MRAVVFDMFETLVSLFTCEVYKGTEIAADLGIPEKDFRSIWNPSEETRAKGEETVEEIISKAMRRFSHYDEELLQTVTRHRTDALINVFVTYRPDITDMLRALKERGIKVALITNCYYEERDVIVQSELFKYFDVALMSCEVGLIKPDRRIFEMCLQKLELDPDECLYVGDGGSCELEAAAAIGMKPCQATWYLKDGVDQPVGRLPEYPEAAEPMDILRFIDTTRT